MQAVEHSEVPRNLEDFLSLKGAAVQGSTQIAMRILRTLP